MRPELKIGCLEADLFEIQILSRRGAAISHRNPTTLPLCHIPGPTCHVDVSCRLTLIVSQRGFQIVFCHCEQTYKSFLCLDWVQNVIFPGWDWLNGEKAEQFPVGRSGFWARRAGVQCSLVDDEFESYVLTPADGIITHKDPTSEP